MMTFAVEEEILVARKVIDGLIAWMLAMLSTRACASISALAAVMAIGTFCRFSLRRCAVTMMSPSPCAWSADASSPLLWAVGSAMVPLVEPGGTSCA